MRGLGSPPVNGKTFSILRRGFKKISLADNLADIMGYWELEEGKPVRMQCARPGSGIELIF